MDQFKKMTVYVFFTPKNCGNYSPTWSRFSYEKNLLVLEIVNGLR